MAHEHLLDFQLAETRFWITKNTKLNKTFPYKYNDQTVEMMWELIEVLILLDVDVKVLEYILINKKQVKKLRRNWKCRMRFKKAKEETIRIFNKLKLGEFL